MVRKKILITYIAIASVLLAFPILYPLISRTRSLTAEIKPGEYYSNKPQIAIWIEDLNGNYVDTLFVTNFSINSKYLKGSNTHRQAALPIWFHKIGRYNGSKLVVNKRVSDTVSGATPRAYFKKKWKLSRFIKYGVYKIRVEVNSSFDFNNTYKRNLPRNSVNFNGYNGQPSVLWEGKIRFSKKLNLKVTLKLVGHGHPSGKTGKVYKNMSNLTTAKKIVKYIIVKYYK